MCGVCHLIGCMCGPCVGVYNTLPWWGQLLVALAIFILFAVLLGVLIHSFEYLYYRGTWIPYSKW